jgi:hypothetical protein
MTSSARARPIARVRYWAAPPPGTLPERRLELGEDRGLSCREPQVAGQHEFAAGTSYAPCDLCDRDQPTRAQVPEEGGDGRFAGQQRRLGRYERFGGSKAQREVIELTLLHALIESGRSNAAQQLIQRALDRPSEFGSSLPARTSGGASAV